MAWHDGYLTCPFLSVLNFNWNKEQGVYLLEITWIYFNVISLSAIKGQSIIWQERSGFDLDFVYRLDLNTGFDLGLNRLFSNLGLVWIWIWI